MMNFCGTATVRCVRSEFHEGARRRGASHRHRKSARRRADAADKLAKVADAFATNPKTMPNLKGFRDARVTSGQVEVLHEQFVK